MYAFTHAKVIEEVVGKKRHQNLPTNLSEQTKTTKKYELNPLTSMLEAHVPCNNSRVAGGAVVVVCGQNVIIYNHKKEFIVE